MQSKSVHTRKKTAWGIKAREQTICDPTSPHHALTHGSSLHATKPRQNSHRLPSLPTAIQPFRLRPRHEPYCTLVHYHHPALAPHKKSATTVHTYSSAKKQREQKRGGNTILYSYPQRRQQQHPANVARAAPNEAAKSFCHTHTHL